MRAGERTLRSEQGAVFVQVGISIFVLMAFNVFVLDYGVMWVSRRQAQNAADAAALAAAVALGYDNYDHPTVVATDSATQTTSTNLIWNEAGVPEVSLSCPAGVTGNCVRVDVFRDHAHGNRIGMLFGPILGINHQSVRATATAIAGSGNATDCLRPIAFADDWDEEGSNSQFNGYIETGPNAGQPYLPAGERDVYTAPSATQSGRTTISGDLGERIIYNLDQVTTAITTPITRELAVGLTLPGTYQSNVENCSGQMVELGQTLPVEVPVGTPMFDAFANLMAADPDVDWNAGQIRIDNSCAPGCASVSPRLIPVALYNPDRFQLGRATNDWTQAGVGCPTNSPCVTISNIVGFFVHGSFAGYGPHGHFLRYPGMTSTTAPTYVDDASWTVTTHLIR